MLVLPGGAIAITVLHPAASRHGHTPPVPWVQLEGSSNCSSIFEFVILKRQRVVERWEESNLAKDLSEGQDTALKARSSPYLTAYVALQRGAVTGPASRGACVQFSAWLQLRLATSVAFVGFLGVAPSWPDGGRGILNFLCQLPSAQSPRQIFVRDEPTLNAAKFDCACRSLLRIAAPTLAVAVARRPMWVPANPVDFAQPTR